MYLLDKVEPYVKPYYYKANGTFEMGGELYSNGFTCEGYGWGDKGNKTYFNLGGKYKTLKFKAGIVASNDETVKFSVCADGEIICTFDMEKGDLPVYHTIDITGCKQLAFFVYDDTSVAAYSGVYGFADIIIK